MRSPRAGVVLGGTVLGLLAVVLVVAMFAPGRQLLSVMVQGALPPAAAADVHRLEPTFDGADRSRPQVPVRLEPWITGVAQPTDVSLVPGHPSRAVVLSKRGQAYLAEPGAPGRAPEEWFSLDVRTKSEMGLLGIAFAPDFESSGRLWVNHNPSEGDPRTVVTELRTDPRTLEEPTRVADVLTVAQPYRNHDAGQLVIGPDGMLYVGLGDGGSGGDPLGAGQDRSMLLGSMLRLDVSTPGRYTVPADNPFVGVDGVRPEIWAYGLRNPWRYTFDPQGRMVVADVGQNAWEEIDLVAAGHNLGWKIREGAHCFEPEEGCATEGLVDPIYDYPHTEGVSVTGGLVWTGPGVLSGKYVFGDFATGRLWALSLPERRERVEPVALGRFDLSPTAFARDAEGRLWVADYRSGAVFRLVVVEG